MWNFAGDRIIYTPRPVFFLKTLEGGGKKKNCGTWLRMHSTGWLTALLSDRVNELYNFLKKPRNIIKNVPTLINDTKLCYSEALGWQSPRNELNNHKGIAHDTLPLPPSNGRREIIFRKDIHAVFEKEFGLISLEQSSIKAMRKTYEET